MVSQNAISMVVENPLHTRFRFGTIADGISQHDQGIDAPEFKSNGIQGIEVTVDIGKNGNTR
jgi:hypothetical protein